MRSAIALRSPSGSICHPDRGSQFRTKKVLRLLGRHGLVGSIRRAYGAGDNASMGSFFALLQKNVLDTRRWDARPQEPMSAKLCLAPLSEVLESVLPAARPNCMRGEGMLQRQARGTACCCV
jgi:transposase InsO family protein